MKTTLVNQKKIRYKNIKMETITRSELEEIKVKIKEIRKELQFLNPLILADFLLIESHKTKLKSYIDRLEPKRPKQIAFVLISSTN